MVPADDPDVVRMGELVREGDVTGLATLVALRPELAVDRHGDHATSRTALHVATDWPGHFPRVRETIEVLVRAGAPVDGRFAGPHRETPLHWAASSDDVAALDALLDAGADIEADGAVLTGGTPLADAVVFAQMAAARRLVERGARMTIWQAAALDDTDAVSAFLLGEPSPGEITNACWHACRAGAAGTARVLLDHGADLDWLGYEGLTCRDAALSSGDAALIAFLADR